MIRHVRAHDLTQRAHRLQIAILDGRKELGRLLRRAAHMDADKTAGYQTALGHHAVGKLTHPSPRAKEERIRCGRCGRRWTTSATARRVGSSRG